ncbi:hypothetical protein DFH09DRAFT_1125041 [Mycena vulgaris]|nr:hypothetical protein DFH09DRAFT_1125041 [Mycena vulgaris]
MQLNPPEGPIPVVDTPGDEPCAKIWSVYISEAEKYDKALVDSWRGNMNGMLIFAGLFSAILTAFPATDIMPAPQPPSLATSSLICNILWFISLGLSLASALTATLRIFSFLYYGLQRFRMHAVVGLIPLLLHMSLLFFFGGLVAFLWPVNKTVAYVAAALLGTILLLYGFMTVLPLMQFDCPYKTPLSNVFWSIRRYLSLLILRRFPAQAIDSPHLHSMVDAMIETATSVTKRALAWTMKSLADDDELEPFVEGIPNSIWGPQGRRRKYDNLIRGLLEDKQVLLGLRIEHLMLSCETGLLELNAKTRRQISCLNAVWCLGMMAEKDNRPVQPLFFLQGSRFLPPATSVTAQYLPSISALAEWNTLCSLHGHVATLATSLHADGVALAAGGLPDIARRRLELQDFMDERRRCNWSYLIPITVGGIDLEDLSKRDNVPWTFHSSSDWVQQVSQVINTIPMCWNGVQYRVLLSFLQQSADLDNPPYEFELTIRTLQAGLEPVDIPVGHVAVTFAENVRKAVQTKTSSSSINHVDVILAILLPWFDKNRDIELDLVNHVTDSVVEYVNNRDSNEAICRILQDCDLTRVWNRVTARLSTCRRDCLGDVSKAMWHLASLFPGLSSPDARLPTFPHFNGTTLSVVPVAPYSGSVMPLIKTHILNAYEAAEIRLHLQALDTEIMANEPYSLSAPLMAALRDIEGDWALLAAVCSLMHPLATPGRPVELLGPFPGYTRQTNQAYRDWRDRALAAVHDAIELIPRLDRRLEEARLAIATEFMQACSNDTDESGLPYKALETFSDSILPILWVSRPAHRDNQKNFAAALRGLAETPEIPPDHLRLLHALIGSALFNEGLPWLDDRQAIMTIKDVLQTYLTVAFADGGSAAQSRKLEDSLNWLETKERALIPEFLLREGQNGAGPSRVKVNGPI